MIKGGVSIHAQNVADAYVMNNPNQMGPGGINMNGKPIKKNLNNNVNNTNNVVNNNIIGNINNNINNFNQGKYVSGNVSHHN